MGLDHYLKRKVRFGLEYSHNINGESLIIINGEIQEFKNLNSLVYTEITWRNKYYIDDFFIREILDSSYVPIKTLKTLIECCKIDLQTLESSKTFIPNDYKLLYECTVDFVNKNRDFIIEDLKSNIEKLTNCLEKPGNFYYERW